MSSSKVWVNKPVDSDLLRYFVNQGFFTPFLAQILINKGFTNLEEAYCFLFPQLTDFVDPFLIPDMEVAVKRIYQAIKSNETIGIYGDSDADGILGSFILYDFLVGLGCKVEWLIPSKEKEGYGFHAKFLPYFKQKGVGLLITVDVGISAGETVNQAKALGIEVIITDHHEVINKPNTIVVSGKLTPKTSPFYHLCGAGVAFALIRALRKYLYEQGFFSSVEIPQIRKYLEIVGLATLADMVPLIGENRTVTFYGFRDLSSPSFLATKLLLENSRTNGVVSEEDLFYRVIPKINAAGRMGSPELIFMFLKEKDETKARALLSNIEEINQKRQELEVEVLSSLEELAKKEVEKYPFIFLAVENLPKGLLGLIANRLKNQYQVPTILISIENGIGFASGRSPEGLNLFEAISRCEDLLIQYGGHKYALGFQVNLEKLDALKERLSKEIKKIASISKPEEEVIYIEAEADLTELLHPENLKALTYLHPYGEAHHPPTILIKNFEIKEKFLLKEKHSKFVLKKGINEISAIWFNRIVEDERIRLVLGQPFVNSYRNNLEIKVVDVR
ncbi:single-stranded-DNA-specific exonuclease RecJ [Thermodesulfobacterium sp. TA1]|uniref:single-stranded-DNA-specific exonuclease RecJ n=1 Tax=Thermodesulfobacterium sp. TA1 TaxID=2234087 RepID=UPI001232336D|nr:single-stranded-DNA-specific exonuclease RecJ [Thermodesulfobacterium sp. TA1]QER41250.1 single-stranded-DNA-specific exonuclease RecJ [Thermodesulfobacterium sp. TA1]